MVRIEDRDMFNETGKREMVPDTIVATSFSVRQHWRSSRRVLQAGFVQNIRFPIQMAFVGVSV